ncbi:MAG: chemotaxis protein CheB [Rhodospirillales bacterium]|nr:chemotaxis protein CheB [Rhodospirillales bacterium]MDE2319942.1 chemotaxis protein CheB [Rhodospirillales bacterium]
MSTPAAVVIGASAGALEALSAILPALPASFALPVFVVIHLPHNRKSILAEIFSAKCRLPVREAEDKEPVVGGTIYFAPPDYHLLVETNYSLALSSDEPVRYSRPSIDVLFESAADTYGPSLIAIVLTGANPDGADGLRKVGEAGGTMIVQNPAEALAPEMPRAAWAACPAARSLPLAGIAALLLGV